MSVTTVATVDIKSLSKGDIIEVSASRCVDGTIVSGTSYVNESMITGGAEPVAKETGDKVLAAPSAGSFRFKATAIVKPRCWRKLSAWLNKTRREATYSRYRYRITLWSSAVMAAATLTFCVVLC